MSEETPNFNIDPDGAMTAPTQFTHNGRLVEIVPPYTAHLIGNYWQIKIDGVLQPRFAVQLVTSGGGPSEKVDRPAGEVIKQPPEGLERLKLVSRLIAFNLIWLKALLATSIPQGVNVSSDRQKQRIYDQENDTNNDGLREPENRESLRWWNEPSERLVGVFSSEIERWYRMGWS